MFQLDLRSRTPIYEQIVEKLKELILLEVLPKDEKLPSVRNLAQTLTINPNTIQKAYRELELQGYIYSVKGRGSFVAENHAQKQASILAITQSLQKLVTEAMQLGMSEEEIIQIIKQTKLLKEE